MISNLKPFKALLLREYWEHKGAMLYTPAFIAGFLAFVMILASLTDDSILLKSGGDEQMSQVLPHAVEMFENLDEQERRESIQMGLYAPMSLFGFVMLIVSFFYALGSLYDERKDRSILFWKSLPVSDASSVLSKIVTICFSIPLVYFAVIAIFQLFILILVTVYSWFGGSMGLSLWGSSSLFSVMLHTLLTLIVASLWLAPVWGWLMLASSWAKKSAFLWGVLPVLLLAFAEAWIFHSNWLIKTVSFRIGEGYSIVNSQLNSLVGGRMLDLPSDNWLEALLNWEFWVGIIVTSIFLAGAVYIRRFRDEA